MTECFAALYIDYEPETALAKLEQARSTVLDADPLCRGYTDAFCSVFKDLVAEFYVKFHGRIDTARVALLIGKEEAEVRKCFAERSGMADIRLFTGKDGSDDGVCTLD